MTLPTLLFADQPGGKMSAAAATRYLLRQTREIKKTQQELSMDSHPTTEPPSHEEQIRKRPPKHTAEQEKGH